MHATIAEVLAERPDLSTGPGELGYHQAQAGDLPAALASHLAAADDAERVYAFADALRIWSGHSNSGLASPRPQSGPDVPVETFWST